jgi:hypothetical protein
MGQVADRRWKANVHPRAQREPRPDTRHAKADVPATTSAHFGATAPRQPLLL